MEIQDPLREDFGKPTEDVIEMTGGFTRRDLELAAAAGSSEVG
jgi:hypothetical protein